jgi:hypothetical protein
VSRIAVVVVGAVALLCIGAVAGCGGDDGGGDTTTATTATEDVRLTQEQWTAYQTSRDAFVTANTTASKRLDKCSAADSPEVLQTCVGNVYGELADATRALGTTLESFGAAVAGSCAVALGGFVNYIGPYAGSAEQIQSAADSGSLPDYQSASEDLGVAAAAAKPEVAAFEKDCAPA